MVFVSIHGVITGMYLIIDSYLIMSFFVSFPFNSQKPLAFLAFIRNSAASALVLVSEVAPVVGKILRDAAMVGMSALAFLLGRAGRRVPLACSLARGRRGARLLGTMRKGVYLSGFCSLLCDQRSCSTYLIQIGRCIISFTRLGLSLAARTGSDCCCVDGVLSAVCQCETEVYAL